MKIKQNIISFILGMAIMLPIGGYAGTTIYQFTQSNDSLFADGIQVQEEMYKKDGSNYLPLRAVSETLGVDVAYNNGRIDLTPPKTDLETVVANCKDSCVMVYVYKDGKAVGQGSGFVYNGYVVTAKHVTDMGPQYMIFADDSLYGVKGTLVSIKTDLDVAVLKADIDLPSVTLGDSDKLREGQKLISITSPGGSKNHIDECTCVGKVYDHNAYFIGISDTFMSEGSSGGAVFNIKSEIIGMADEGTEGVNSSIPINDLKPILEKLK